jgi:CubicO group peptidase (beta-lactamase class C family)
MRPFLASVGLAIVLLATQVAGQQPPVFTPFGAIPVLDAYLESLRQQMAIPGMTAAVVRDGSIIWERGYGFHAVRRRRHQRDARSHDAARMRRTTAR